MSATTEHSSPRLDQHVSDMDTLFWRVEKDPLLRNTMVAVFLLEKSPDRQTVMERMERASRQVPGWRHRLQSPPLYLANPRWVVDPNFDLTYHVRWIGANKERTFLSVLDYARTSAMSGLDRDRPLWTMTVVEGLEDDQAAVIVKVHHALMDGLGGIGVLPLVVDLAPDTARVDEMPAEPTGRPLSTGELVIDALAVNAQRVQRMVGGLGRGAQRLAPTVLKAPGEIIPAVQRNVKALGRLLKPPTRSLSPIMIERRGWSRFVPVEADLGALKRASRAHRASLNGAFLAGVAYGFAKYHEELGKPVEQLRTTVAINMRKPSDPPGGNHILGGHFVMPVSAAGPEEFIAVYHSLVKQLRDDTHQPLAGKASSLVTALGPFIAGYVGTNMRHSDLLMSNIPGIDAPMWFAGASVLSFYGFGPIMGTATNATMVTYNGTAHVGLNIDVSAVTEPDLLVECVREGFVGLCAAGAADEGEVTPRRAPRHGR